MKKYLSIGEISKLKGVGIKSLRYYDQIGILKPAYVNPQTGYRYYTLEQMVTLDVILLCLELDIPLKLFHKYIDLSGNLSIDLILEDGQRIANEKIKKIQEVLCKMKNLSNHISQYKQNKNKDEEYLRKLPSRTFLVTPWNGDLNDIKLFMKKTTELYKYSLELETTPLYQRGIVYFYNETGIEKFVFLEVYDSKQMNDDFRILPAGQYQCRLFSNEESDKAYEYFMDNPNIPAGTIIIGTEMYDANINNDPAPIEIQLFGDFFNNKFAGK